MSKKLNKIYSRKGINVVLTLHDETWRKLDVFKWNETNKTQKAIALKTIRDKYGINFKPTIDPDLDWLK